MESRRVVIKQPRTKSGLFLALLAIAALWGALGIASTGFERTFRLVALVACGLTGLFFLYFLVRPPTVLEISYRGIRFAGRREVAWTDVERLKILVLPTPFLDSCWMRVLFPFPWVVRRASRYLGVVSVEGSEVEARTARPLRRMAGTVPVVSQAQLPMPLEKVANMIKEFAPTVPIDYGPGAEPTR